MLIEQTLEKLTALKLTGMVSALRQWMEGADREAVAAQDLVGLLTDAEATFRENRKMTNRLRKARFRQPACVEEIDYPPIRGLTKAAVRELASCRWIRSARNLIITGPTGTGKTFLACALGHKACREGLAAVYLRASRLYDELYQAKGDGTYRRSLARLAKTPLLVLDDFGLEPLDPDARRNLLEVLEDRSNVSSTLITSQLDPKEWHAVIGDETIADAICDRIVHNAERIKLAGESMRKVRRGTSQK